MEPEEKAAPASTEPAETKPKKPFPKKMLIIVGVLLIQVVGSYFLQKSFLFGSPNVAKAKTLAEDSLKQKGKDGEADKLKVVTLDEIIVNPAETGGRRYLATTIGLQTPVAEADKKVEEQRPLVRDAIITLLSAKHLEELADINYRDSLKIQIRDAINAKVPELKVQNVVFSGYVLQ